MQKGIEYLIENKVEPTEVDGTPINTSKKLADLKTKKIAWGTDMNVSFH